MEISFVRFALMLEVSEQLPLAISVSDVENY